MNYIELINNVWSMREQGIISSHEQDLYMYLIHRSNMLFWKNPFNQPTEVLCSVLNINRNALTARRNRLKQLELIDFKEGKTKNRPAEYTILYNTDNAACNTPLKQEQHPSAIKKGKEKFHPPDVQEVGAYCKERNNRVDAQRFVDFYTAKGWMLGKNKMKNWKAAVRTWERNDSLIAHPAASHKQHNTETDERF